MQNKNYKPNSLASRIADLLNGSDRAMSLDEIAERLGSTAVDVGKRLHRLYAADRIKRSQVIYKQGSSNVKEKTNDGLDGFRKLYDKSYIVPKTIQEKIDTYLKKHGWEYDENFRVACGIKLNDWRRFRGDFSHLHVTVEGKIVWGHPDIIDEMRDIVLR